jgi:hypothetical protein
MLRAWSSWWLLSNLRSGDSAERRQIVSVFPLGWHGEHHADKPNWRQANCSGSRIALVSCSHPLRQTAIFPRMTTLTAHFDGKVLIPDQPVELPVNCALEVRVQPLKKPATLPPGDRPLMRFIKLLEELPDNPDAPTDGAAQHDHYLYGLPKRS